EDQKPVVLTLPVPRRCEEKLESENAYSLIAIRSARSGFGWLIPGPNDGDSVIILAHERSFALALLGSPVLIWPCALPFGPAGSILFQSARHRSKWPQWNRRIFFSCVG